MLGVLFLWRRQKPVCEHVLNFDRSTARVSASVSSKASSRAARFPTTGPTIVVASLKRGEGRPKEGRDTRSVDEGLFLVGQNVLLNLATPPTKTVKG